jgi:DNA-directed RNA polymerase subunit beta'
MTRSTWWSRTIPCCSTAHRLGIQAFEPLLVEGKAIRIHPLVCAAFNADFDGDQMAVHVPLSPIAQIEAHTLMMSTNNLLLPASGRPIIVPSQDIVLGIYYLTKSRGGRAGEGHVFASVDEARMAYQLGLVEVHSRVKFRHRGNYVNLEKAYDSQDLQHAEVTRVESGLIDTTVGRILFNAALPPGFPFINGLIKKKGLESLFNFSVLRHGRDVSVALADAVKELGFISATRSGVSVGIEDMLVPDTKEELIGKAQKEVNAIHDEYKAGAITNRERYNKVVDVWNRVTDTVADAMFKKIELFSSSSSPACAA